MNIKCKIMQITTIKCYKKCLLSDTYTKSMLLIELLYQS